MLAKKVVELDFPRYKDKPLVRSKDTIYYGDMSDPYIVEINIKSKSTSLDLELADKVVVRLLSTDVSLSPKKRIIKFSEKEGLYLALDIADVWLHRALEEAAAVQ